MKKKLLLYKFRICKVAAFCVGGGKRRIGLGGKWDCEENRLEWGENWRVVPLESKKKGKQPPAYCHNREMFPPLSALFKFFQHIFIKKGCNYYGNICCKIRR